ncbi:hypothetical protein Poli38472_006672 [Pythium oligandrum]|uniref:Zinc transporter n=1 Tax=Pythium oligandrum TaxID=41045 RepID=A0A8K1C518_PYTOL|nr:hypothetical protein Poli38472_006672 [Pythium oligandrum]|eukprot:TMW56662.1 hypothetical protein Poli38472_006672 [Pythium oligandrum]
MASRSSPSRFLRVLLVVTLLATLVVAQEEECNGQGKRHGNHCHCNKGYTSKGLECVAVGGGATCPAGGITWEVSSAYYFEKGSYSLELMDNSENMATFVLPMENVTEMDDEALEDSVLMASTLLEDVTLARKVVKSKQEMAPTTKLLYVIQRNNAEELEKLKAECEATAGNTWHIDHCDGPDGHGRRRRLADSKMTVNLTVVDTGFYALHMQHNAYKEFGLQILNAKNQPVKVALSKESEDEDSEEKSSSSGSKKVSGAVWGKTMAAVTVVCLLSVVGILLLSIRSAMLNRLMDAFIALSSGALFGAAFIHILPEAIEFSSEYGQMDLKLAMYFTVGFVVAMIVEMLLEVAIGQVDGGDHHDHHNHHLPLSGRSSALKLMSPQAASQSAPVTTDGVSNSPAFVDMENAADGKSSIVAAPQSFWSLTVDWSKIKPMAYIILLGDLFHNFVDGVLIATAFLACDDALGISVTVSAILHELPQEFADFIILVDSGFTPFQAVVFNFVSALSCYLGAIIILGSIQVTKQTMGVLLGIGAGTLVYIAATDLLPRVLRVKTFTDFFVRIILFGVGIGILVLTTLHHVHCEAEL